MNLQKFHPRKSGLMSNVVETVEYAGASYAYGYFLSKHREKASIFGVPADLAVGAGLKLLAFGAEMFGHGAALAPHANVLGNAGIGAYMHTLGSGKGAGDSGVKRIAVAPGTSPGAVKTAMRGLPGSTVLGDLPKAPRGDFLSARDLADLARG